MTNHSIKAPIFAISRLRTGTDGSGITILVTFMGCPLQCKYCLNKKCHEPIYESDGKTLRKGIMLLTPQELYDLVKIDNIYIFRVLEAVSVLAVASLLYMSSLYLSLKNFVVINGRLH